MKHFIPFRSYYLKESVIDIPRNSLDPTVFSFPEGDKPILQSVIRKQIQRDVERINGVYPVKKYYIIGSIVTHRYNISSDIDVNVEIEYQGHKEEEVSMEALLRVVKSLSGKLAVGTTHPINYYLMQEEYDLDKTDAAYDVANDKWLKTENPDDDLELTQYADKFQEAISHVDIMTGELRRDIIDLNIYKALPERKIKKLQGIIQKKLDEIEDDIIKLSNTNRSIHHLRQVAFNKDLTQDELSQYANQNWLPENVIYKLYGKYHYSQFIKKLKEFLDSKEELDTNDIPYLQKLGSQLWQQQPQQETQQ